MAPAAEPALLRGEVSPSRPCRAAGDESGGLSLRALLKSHGLPGSEEASQEDTPGKDISPWHDIDLKVSDGVYNAVFEIPKTTKPTTEVSLDCRVPEIVRRAEQGDGGAVLALLQGGESPDAADDFGLTALHVAAKKGHAAVVGHLVGARADVNRRAAGLRGETPALYACKYGHAGVLSLLLSHGADPGLATTDGRLPSQLARDKGHLEVEEILLRVLRWSV